MSQPSPVQNADQLLQAIAQKAEAIEVKGAITDLTSFSLAKGQKLYGDGTASLGFKSGQPGVMLAADCVLRDLRISTDLTQIAVGLVDDGADLGRIEVQNINTRGRVHLEAQGAMRGDLHLENIHVEAADARMAARRPAGFGVEVLLGGLSVYNSSRHPQSAWEVSAYNLSCGTQSAPVRGGGIFIFGGDYIPVESDMLTAPAPSAKGGQIHLKALTTNAVFTDGGIPAGIGNLITGGVFVGSGVQADAVTNAAEVTTFGPNDMVLDNWGDVTLWTAQARITSHGPSGIGFVNFGKLNTLRVEAEIVTNGLGARGFNLYDGRLKRGYFHSITTQGDGAIGIQISKPFGEIEVAGDVVTHGGTGQSLVRGKVVTLTAHALSLKSGAEGAAIRIKGRLRTAGPEIAPLDIEEAPDRVRILELGQ